MGKDLRVKVDEKKRKIQEQMEGNDEEYLEGREKLKITAKSVQSATDNLLSASKFLEGLTGERTPMSGHDRRSTSPPSKVNGKRPRSPHGERTPMSGHDRRSTSPPSKVNGKRARSPDSEIAFI